LGAVTIWLISRPAVRSTMLTSVARFIGTLVGSLGAVIIMAIVAQSPVTALVLMALWLAGCAAGATLPLMPTYTYTFQLAGFAILTAIAASIPDPNHAFLIAIDNCAGVSLGIFCVFAVDALFPYGLDVPTSPPAPRIKGTLVQAAVNAAIAGGAVLVTGAFWMATAWPQGIYFLFAAGLVTVFFAPTLKPDVLAAEWAQGIALSGLVSSLYVFVLLPQATTFAGLAAFFVPVLVLGGLVVAIPRLAQAGLVIAMAYLFILIQPTNAQRTDPMTFLNNGLAYTLGGVFGTVAFRFGGRGTWR